VKVMTSQSQNRLAVHFGVIEPVEKMQSTWA
jgi:hypothetical protein